MWHSLVLRHTLAERHHVPRFGAEQRLAFVLAKARASLWLDFHVYYQRQPQLQTEREPVCCRWVAATTGHSSVSSAKLV